MSHLSSNSATRPAYRLQCQLSSREQDVLRLLVDGCSNAEIANELYLSTNTVKSHVRSLLNKFGVEHRLQVAVLALRHGLV